MLVLQHPPGDAARALATPTEGAARSAAVVRDSVRFTREAMDRCELLMLNERPGRTARVQQVRKSICFMRSARWKMHVHQGDVVLRNLRHVTGSAIPPFGRRFDSARCGSW